MIGVSTPEGRRVSPWSVQRRLFRPPLVRLLEGAGRAWFRFQFVLGGHYMGGAEGVSHAPT